MARHAKNGKTKVAGRSASGSPPPGMIVTKSGRLIARPAARGTIPVSKIRAAIEKLPRARGD